MSDAHKRNLAVPFFTQRDNTYVWQQRYEKDYTTDFILEQDITINKDEIEIEFNFDIEKVLDEEFDGEMEIFCRIIYEEKDIASKLNSKLIVRTQGGKR